jgi:hypothetical protein
VEVDSATGGLPRGCLTEIVGPASSGRTSLLMGILAAATARQEACALVDAEDAFSPHSAADAGVQLERLLWVRCGHSAEHALKAADLLIQGGGFGLVVMDLGDTLPKDRTPHFAGFLVPPAPRGGTYTHRAGLSRTAIQRQDLRGDSDRVRAQGDNLVRHAFRSRLLRGFEVRATSTQRRKQCSPVFTARAI